MTAPLTIGYHFAFPDGESTAFVLELERSDLRLRPATVAPPPEWTALAHQQCRICPLTPAESPCCPIALNLADVVARFAQRFSYQGVAVTVTTAERSYFKETTLQEGLSSLLGIVMVTSGCRPMERLKPLVRFHLPFASLEETTFRTIALHLITQLLRREQGLAADFGLSGLAAIYAEVAEVNNRFAKRLLTAAQKDANLNALVNLHCFTTLVPASAAELLRDLEGSFAALLAPAPSAAAAGGEEGG